MFFCSLLSDVRCFARHIETWVKTSIEGFPEYLVCCKLQGKTFCLNFYTFKLMFVIILINDILISSCSSVCTLSETADFVSSFGSGECERLVLSLCKRIFRQSTVHI